jgi:predicted secreted protein
MNTTEYKAAIESANARAVANKATPTIVTVTLAARKRDPYIATRVKGGQFSIVQSIPRKGKSNNVIELAGPMPGWQAVEALERFAAGGSL